MQFSSTVNSFLNATLGPAGPPQSPYYQPPHPGYPAYAPNPGYYYPIPKQVLDLIGDMATLLLRIPDIDENFLHNLKAASLNYPEIKRILAAEKLIEKIDLIQRKKSFFQIPEKMKKLSQCQLEGCLKPSLICCKCKSEDEYFCLEHSEKHSNDKSKKFSVFFKPGDVGETKDQIEKNIQWIKQGTIKICEAGREVVRKVIKCQLDLIRKLEKISEFYRRNFAELVETGQLKASKVEVDVLANLKAIVGLKFFKCHFLDDLARAILVDS